MNDSDVTLYRVQSFLTKVRVMFIVTHLNAVYALLPQDKEEYFMNAEDMDRGIPYDRELNGQGDDPHEGKLNSDQLEGLEFDPDEGFLDEETEVTGRGGDTEIDGATGEIAISIDNPAEDAVAGMHFVDIDEPSEYGGGLSTHDDYLDEDTEDD